MSSMLSFDTIEYHIENLNNNSSLEYQEKSEDEITEIIRSIKLSGMFIKNDDKEERGRARYALKKLNDMLPPCRITNEKAFTFLDKK